MCRYISMYMCVSVCVYICICKKEGFCSGCLRTTAIGQTESSWCFFFFLQLLLYNHVVKVVSDTGKKVFVFPAFSRNSTA